MRLHSSQLDMFGFLTSLQSAGKIMTTKNKEQELGPFVGVGDGGESCGDPVHIPCGDNDDGEEKVVFEEMTSWSH